MKFKFADTKNLILYTKTLKKQELHIFNESSSKADSYAAYFRVVKSKKAKASFVINKSQLAPFKKAIVNPKIKITGSSYCH